MLKLEDFKKYPVESDALLGGQAPNNGGGTNYLTYYLEHGPTGSTPASQEAHNLLED